MKAFEPNKLPLPFFERGNPKRQKKLRLWKVVVPKWGKKRKGSRHTATKQLSKQKEGPKESREGQRKGEKKSERERERDAESEERKTFTKESSMNRCANAFVAGYFTYEPLMLMTSRGWISNQYAWATSNPEAQECERQWHLKFSPPPTFHNRKRSPRTVIGLLRFF